MASVQAPGPSHPNIVTKAAGAQFTDLCYLQGRVPVPTAVCVGGRGYGRGLTPG